MLLKLPAIALVLATSLTGAVPAAHRQVDSLALGSGPGGASCASSGAFCCNSTIPAQDADSSLTTFLGALGMGLENLANNLGLGCASMTSGVSCSSSVLCCDNSVLSGLIAVGCVSS